MQHSSGDTGRKVIECRKPLVQLQRAGKSCKLGETERDKKSLTVHVGLHIPEEGEKGKNRSEAPRDLARRVHVLIKHCIT